MRGTAIKPVILARIFERYASNVLTERISKGQTRCEKADDDWEAKHAPIVVVLSGGPAQLLPHHLQLVGQRGGLQRSLLLLGQPQRQLALGLLHQQRGRDPLLLCRLVRHGQVGTEVDTLRNHDDRRNLMHMLHVRFQRYRGDRTRHDVIGRWDTLSESHKRLQMAKARKCIASTKFLQRSTLALLALLFTL